MAGHRELHLIGTEFQLKELIRKLPPQTIVTWQILKDPSFKDCPEGVIPKLNGVLEYGAY
jgi:hypothetical protein